MPPPPRRDLRSIPRRIKAWARTYWWSTTYKRTRLKVEAKWRWIVVSIALLDFLWEVMVIGSTQDDTEISLVSRCQQRKICFLTSCWHLPEHLSASFWCNWYWSTRDHQRGGLDDGLLVVAGLLCCFFWLFCLLLRGVTWIGLCAAYPYICVFRRKFLQGMRIRISAVKYEFLCRFRSFWILFDSSARVQTLGLQKSRSSVWKDFSVQDFFSFYVNNTGYLPIIPTIRCLRQECSCEFSKH